MGREYKDNTDRLIIELPLNGNLDKVLRLFITTLGSGLQAIALALSAPHDNSAEVQAQIDKATEQLKSSTNALDAAVKANQPKQQ